MVHFMVQCCVALVVCYRVWYSSFLTPFIDSLTCLLHVTGVTECAEIVGCRELSACGQIVRHVVKVVQDQLENAHLALGVLEKQLL